jgi:hypothetical protein
MAFLNPPIYFYNAVYPSPTDLERPSRIRRHVSPPTTESDRDKQATPSIRNLPAGRAESGEQ